MIWNLVITNISAAMSKTHLRTCAPSADSLSQGCKVSSCGQRKLWSDCADAQADLSLRWTNRSEGTLFLTLMIIFSNMFDSIHTKSSKDMRRLPYWNYGCACCYHGKRNAMHNDKAVFSEVWTRYALEDWLYNDGAYMIADNSSSNNC